MFIPVLQKRNLKKTISRLNDLAYADALTSLHNRGAFDIMVREMQTQIDQPEGPLAFAVCMFDCNSLKQINDAYGHDKGDIYLKETTRIICDVFEHSPVFRIGGDEFAAILLHDDFRNRDALTSQMENALDELKQDKSLPPWEKISAAIGLATYDPKKDTRIKDVFRRADSRMYEKKKKTQK